MARLKNLNLATLSPAQQQWWKGLKDAPQLGPGTKSFRFPIKPQKRPGAGKPSHGNTGTPDTDIATLALQAALFLVKHWPKVVAEVGEPAFKAARVQEILTGQFPEKYWLECTIKSEETRIGYPTCSTDHPPPPLKFQTPGSKNTVCKYDTTYPDAGNAGYSGMTAADEFYRDQWLKQKNYIFDLPEPDADVGLRPLFCNVVADWSVTLQKAHRQPFCSLFKSAIAETESGFAKKNDSIDSVSRYFYYQYEPPAVPLGGGTTTMHREFRVDCNYLAGDFGFKTGKAGVALLQLAPASARGLYHFGNTSMDTTLALQVKTYQAKIDDTHDPSFWTDRPRLYAFGGEAKEFLYTWGAPKVGGPCTVEMSVIKAYAEDRRDYHGIFQSPARYFPSIAEKCQYTGLVINVPVIDYQDIVLHPSAGPTPPAYFVFLPYSKGVHPKPNTVFFCQIPGRDERGYQFQAWGYTAISPDGLLIRPHLFLGPMPPSQEWAIEWESGKWPA